MKRWILLFVSLASLSAHALQVNPIGSLGFEFGGEKFASFTYADGKERSFKAASLAYLAGGVAVPHSVASHNFSARSVLGFKAASLRASNASLDFFRWLFEVSEAYVFPSSGLHAGLGLTYHFSNKVTGKDDAVALTSELKPSLGVFAQVDYPIFRGKSLGLGIDQAFVGLRYTLQSYQAKAGGDKISANGIGFHVNFVW